MTTSGRVIKLAKKRVEASVVLSPEEIDLIMRAGFGYEMESEKGQYKSGEAPIYLDLMPLLASVQLRAIAEARANSWIRILTAQIISLCIFLAILYFKRGI